MTPTEALAALRVTLPDVVEQVIHDGIGQPSTQVQAHGLAIKLRAATTLDEAIGYDEQLDELSQSDPPFREAMLAHTQPLRDKADAESFAGQARQAARKVQDAAEGAAKTATNIGTIVVVGLGLYALVEAAKWSRKMKGAIE